MRLAHYSDIHVTHFPLAGAFALKRLAAVASYTLAGRGRHFVGSSHRIAKLLADVDAQQVDHALCTGDLTGVSTEEEFSEVAALFGPRLEQPALHTCLPGNHDRYVAGVEGLYEKHFGRISEGATFPFLKRVGQLVIVGLDAARPTSLVDSSGLIGDSQRAKVLELLTDTSLRDAFVVVALHYGLKRGDGSRDARAHGLRDDLELTALLDRDDVTCDLVLHGHMHRPYLQQTAKRRIVCVGSATDLHVRCGYHVYDVDPAKHSVVVSRREWNEAADGYVAVTDSPLVGTFNTR